MTGRINTRKQFQRLVTPGQELLAMTKPADQRQIGSFTARRQRDRIIIVSQADFS